MSHGEYNCPKCHHAHEACGSDEEDSGKKECDECGFEFIVEIEYLPVYETTCVKHDFGDPQVINVDIPNEKVWRRFICGVCGHIFVE
jgi:transcription elongation factor Elf1